MIVTETQFQRMLAELIENLTPAEKQEFRDALAAFEMGKPATTAVN